jgi:NAD(P)-dependent dehydrogenase (short-subunit alcohol dehydrogenase family)
MSDAPSPSESAVPSGFDVTGRVVIVTGASSGIGRDVAVELARAGASVVAAARRLDRLERLRGAASTPIEVVACDVADPDDRARLVDTVVARFGRIDGLVNNAGLTGRGVPATKESDDEVDAMLAVNLRAPLDLAKRCVPPMRAAGGGSIVNITTMATIVTMATAIPQAGYCASKAGLTHLTRELAVQWARYDIRVNAIAPGWIPTEMTSSAGLTPIGVPGWIDGRLPLRRPGSGIDIARAAQFLLSPASGYITGQEIAVDGGYSVT